MYHLSDYLLVDGLLQFFDHYDGRRILEHAPDVWSWCWFLLREHRVEEFGADLGQSTYPVPMVEQLLYTGMWYYLTPSLRFLPAACLVSMEFWVLSFTICCLVIATIYGGRRVLLRPPNTILYLNGVQKLMRSIYELSNDFGSMEISTEQCRLLHLECLRLVQLPQPLSILKESFCALRRALKLMQDCRSENWLLKAVELGNCQRHFLEILLDLHRLPIVVELVGFRGEALDDMAARYRSIDISEETESEIRIASRSDKEALMRKLESASRHNCPDYCLADQLEATPSLIAPDDIGRLVTEFDILKSKCIHKDDSGVCVFRVLFCNKEFVIKTRFSKLGAEEQDIKLLKEATAMKLCRHPHAVALLGSWEFIRTMGLDTVTRVPLLLMESMECDLKSVIKRNKRRLWWGGTGGFPALDAINLLLPVAKVMKYLHEIGVVHLDLKPQNILFSQVPGTQGLPDDVSVKLVDFGDAQMAEVGVITRVGTSGYMDPDVWARREGADLFQADVFSFGMVFGEVLTGSSPLEALDCMYPREFYGRLRRGEPLPLPEETPMFVKSIVESCLKLQPDQRPSFAEICWKLQNTEFLLLNGLEM